MASSGSSLESTRPHSRRDLRRSSRSRDTRPPAHHEEADYGDEEITPLPSINPPPGTEIARGIPDPPPHSDPTTGDSSHHNITTSAPPSNPRPPQSSFTRSQSTPTFPPTPPAHLTGPFFPPPRVQAPRPRPPLSHPRATGPPRLNPYAPRPRPRQPSPRDHRTSRTTRSPLTRHHDRRRSPRSRSAHSRRHRGHRHRSPAASRSRRDDRHSRRSHSRRHRSRTHQREQPFPPQEHRRTSNLPPTRSRSCHSSHHHGRARAYQPTPRSAPRATSHGTPVSPPASVHPPSDRDSSVAPPLVLLPGPGDRPHPQPTPPVSASISRPTTPPQAFQPPPATPLTALPASEAEELRQLRLQFQQQQHAAHRLQQQALFHSPFNPFFPHSSSTFLHPPYPLPQLHLPIHPPALHPPMFLQQPQNQRQLPRNPPTFPSPSSPLKRPPSLQLPPRQIRLREPGPCGESRAPGADHARRSPFCSLWALRRPLRREPGPQRRPRAPQPLLHTAERAGPPAATTRATAPSGGSPFSRLWILRRPLRM